MNAIQTLYNATYDFITFLINDPTIDHLDVRFGREVIFDSFELNSNQFNVTPLQRTVEDVIPIAARRKGSGELVISCVTDDSEKDGFNRSERM